MAALFDIIGFFEPVGSFDMVGPFEVVESFDMALPLELVGSFETVESLTGRRHNGDRRFIKWTRFLVKASWLNIRRKCCNACGTGTRERYCLI